MLTVVVAIQGILLIYLLFWRVAQREQTRVMTHFIWSLYEATRSHCPDAEKEEWFRWFVGTAAEEALQFTWVKPLDRFVHTKRLLFADERYGRFGMHAYREYFERIRSSWNDANQQRAQARASRTNFDRN